MANGTYTFHRHLTSPYSVKGSGIYAIINRDNLKIYVGSGVRLNHRWTEHRHDLAKRVHHSRYFQRAFDKNPDAFEVQVIEELPGADKSTLIAREQFWMDFYQSYRPDTGYNISPKSNSCQGIKRDPEYVARVSASLKGRKMSPERLATHRKAMNGHKGRKFTPEQKAEQSRRMTGKKYSEEWRENISKGHRANPWQQRAVLQFSLDWKFIRRFEQVQHAEAELGGRTNIHAVCNGKRRQACGYVWRYATEAKETDEISARKKITPGPKNGRRHG
jgi:group I intron endonuclease